nr:reverse transcriptase domain-containing protein [Tanacetum cinerariifolium]
MTKKDKEKTTFHTNEGVFCYTKMPFGLKNAKATYQRLVNTIFEGQMGSNLEAYMDDMVIKSKTKPEMIKDAEETLLTLKKVNMKLNPKKCSFGMEEGKFLGYIVTFEGIRANLEKAMVVINMSSPSNLKQIHNGRGQLRTNKSKWTERCFGRRKKQKRAGSSVAKTYKNLGTEADIWKLYTDIASNEHESGAGLILIDPEGAEYSYALRVNFANSNNDVEYEAMLAGLRIAAKIKISQKPREDNKKADALSKLAVVQCKELTKGVLIEELNERSVDTTKVNAIVEETTRTWMILIQEHSCSCVSNDLPFDGYDRDDVQRLCARLIYLREMREEVFVRSGLKMSIYDFMTLPSWSDAKIVEESHLSLPLLERVPSHTTAPASKGAIISVPTLNEIVASLPDPRLAKKSKEPSLVSQPLKKRKLQKRASKAGSSASELGQAEGVNEADLADLCFELEDSLEKDTGVPTRAVSAPIPRLGKRSSASPSIAIASVFEPSHVGTLAPAPTSGHSLSLGGVVASGRAGMSGAQMDEISDDDFGTATRGEEIYLTLFTLAPGPYYMPYCMKDPDVCRKALDRTITLAELMKTESLLPLELSNLVNVLSALLVSYGYELNSRYTNLVSSRAHLQEKLDKKKGDVELLRS